MRPQNHGTSGTVIRGAFVVAMDRDRTASHRDIHVDPTGRIQAMLPPQSPVPNTVTVDATGTIIVPGLVQAHLHLCQTLFRGLGESRPLLRWLRERIWPLEGAHDQDSLRASADLGLAELLLSGTTAVLDMGTVHHTDALFQASRDAGIRYVGGKAMMDTGEGVPASLVETTSQSLAESERLLGQWHGAAGGRLHYAWCPRFVLSCTPDLLRSVAVRSLATGTRIHSHASEQQDEAAIVRAAYGAPNIATLGRFGITGNHVVLAHGVWPDDAEIAQLAQEGTHVVHCPSSNLKLGSGIAPLRAYLDANVQVAIGADGAACSNTLDAWSELRLAHLLASLVGGPGSIDAEAIFALATICGARALGLSHEIGSIEAGKWADLVSVTTDQPHACGAGDVYTTLVHSVTRNDVRDVWIGGRPIVQNQRLLTIDIGSTIKEAHLARTRVSNRIGLC